MDKTSTSFFLQMARRVSAKVMSQRIILKAQICSFSESSPSSSITCIAWCLHSGDGTATSLAKAWASQSIDDATAVIAWLLEGLRPLRPLSDVPLVADCRLQDRITGMPEVATATAIPATGVADTSTEATAGV
jgi:hypothetical protein